MDAAVPPAPSVPETKHQSEQTVSERKNMGETESVCACGVCVSYDKNSPPFWFCCGLFCCFVVFYTKEKGRMTTKDKPKRQALAGCCCNTMDDPKLTLNAIPAGGGGGGPLKKHAHAKQRQEELGNSL